MSDRPVRFFHRGSIVEVDAALPTRSVLDWLREDARCTGTKEGCNEGDCGACTVVVGELAAPHEPGAVGGLRLQTVNACIRFLPTLDGCALFTVEDLKPIAGGALHPVQQAMLDCHASQCGFCTPGFVMSLWSAYEHPPSAAPNRQQLADALAGNLCRCTGYRPILDAGQRMFELPAARLDTAPVVAALRGLQQGGRLDTEGFHAPTTLDALAALRVRLPDARLLAGGTDIGVSVNKQFRALGEIVYLGRVEALKRIETANGELRIGAGASLEAAYSALAALSPALTEVWLRFASPPIRHAGTLGGNIANGSPIGDSPPLLMALDAVLELRRGETVRRLPLDDFYLDYMTSRMQPGEFVQTVVVPLAALARTHRAYKVSKRFDSDISAVCAGLAIDIDAGIVRVVRLAYGGMAAVVKRAVAAEAVLLGKPWQQASVDAAKAALADDFEPLSDMRASAAYRLQVAQNLLQRFWLETRADAALEARAVNVWSRP